MLGIFLDTETTGLSSRKHRVLEIALKCVDLRSGDLRGEYNSVVRHSEVVWEASDPESLRINGFTWELMETGRPELEVSEAIVGLFGELKIGRRSAIFICQNPSFDRGFFSQLVETERQEALQWPYHWLDLASMFWALEVRKSVEGKAKFPGLHLSKDDIARKYKLGPEAKPHRAMNGVDHLLLCYRNVVGFPGPQ